MYRDLRVSFESATLVSLGVFGGSVPMSEGDVSEHGVRIYWLVGTTKKPTALAIHDEDQGECSDSAWIGGSILFSPGFQQIRTSRGEFDLSGPSSVHSCPCLLFELSVAFASLFHLGHDTHIAHVAPKKEKWKIKRNRKEKQMSPSVLPTSR